MSEISSFDGPYARLREVINSSRQSAGDGPYAQGVIDTLNLIEHIIAELEEPAKANEGGEE